MGHKVCSFPMHSYNYGNGPQFFLLAATYCIVQYYIRGTKLLRLLWFAAYPWMFSMNCLYSNTIYTGGGHIHNCETFFCKCYWGNASSKEQHKPVVVMCNKSYDINLVKCLQNYKENRTPNKTIGRQRDNSLIGILTKRNKKKLKKKQSTDALTKNSFLVAHIKHAHMNIEPEILSNIPITYLNHCTIVVNWKVLLHYLCWAI